MKLFNIFRIVIINNTIIIFSEETASIYELINYLYNNNNICSLERVDTKKNWWYDKIEIDTHQRKLCRNNILKKIIIVNSVFFFFVLSFLWKELLGEQWFQHFLCFNKHCYFLLSECDTNFLIFTESSQEAKQTWLTKFHARTHKDCGNITIP